VLFLVHRFLSPWWRRRQVPPKRRFLQEPHGVATQKTPFFTICICFRKLIPFRMSHLKMQSRSATVYKTLARSVAAVPEVSWSTPLSWVNKRVNRVTHSALVRLSALINVVYTDVDAKRNEPGSTYKRTVAYYSVNVWASESWERIALQSVGSIPLECCHLLG
jgi:hypothetical protein